MIRNLKILFAAAMALAAIGAINAVGASAAEFHCSVEPCRVTLKPDGTANTKTAHHVFIVTGKNAAGHEVSGTFTCGQLAGSGESLKKTFSELAVSLEYRECLIAGTPVTVDTTGCSFLLKAAGTMNVNCGTGSIKFTVGSPVVCTVSVPSQTNLSSIKFHDAGTTKTELTWEISILTGINGVVAAGTDCEDSVGFSGNAIAAHYTTGNTILTGETPPGVMANFWFE